MAKSLRSKVKRSFRAKKREEGVYAAASAARLARLNSKLSAIAQKEADHTEEEQENIDQAQEVPAEDATASLSQTDGMTVDSESTSQPSTERVSTHGPRNSRRERWRVSKGMTPRPAINGMNRQGGIAGRRKAGRSHRRR
ncbi:hypothetical protein BKA70DRAFT_1258131 [Coprinopsis sp. MPI-PUGE-AT-0042]|nr:hypothetical protein BKA70DRAFT_1258131 [Coprinopsis sp. MPI-PUGE-AT-0042]